MSKGFGARLRAQRERQQVPLAAVAQQTKIKRSLLEGLERDDVTYWPHGIFRRAYIRAYARAIGLEPEPLVSEFLALYPDSVTAVPADLDAEVGAGDMLVGSGPPTRIRYALASGITTLRRSLGHASRGELAAAEVRSAFAGPPVAASAADHAPESGLAPAEPPEGGPRVVESPAIIAAAVASPPVRESAPAPAPRLDLSDVAHLCASLSRVSTAQEIEALLEDAARMLDAVGLVVWSWEPRSRVLGPSLMHGYPDDVATRFPRVRRDGDNAVAAAFRSAETRVVIGDGATTGAVVVPMLSPGGCVGVFAVELRNGGEQHETVRALATILAAQLAGLVGAAPLAEAVNG